MRRLVLQSVQGRRWCSTAWSGNRDLVSITPPNSKFCVTLLGVNHMCDTSVEQVKATIEDLSPDAVAIELDRERASMLLAPASRRHDIEPSESYEGSSTEWEDYFASEAADLTRKQVSSSLQRSHDKCDNVVFALVLWKAKGQGASSSGRRNTQSKLKDLAD
jgi:hypothetical protein